MENSEIVIRLDPQLEQTVSWLAWQMGISKSELVRRSIVEFVGKTGQTSSWELGQELFGKYHSGKDNLSVNRKLIFQEKIRAK